MALISLNDKYVGFASDARAHIFHLKDSKSVSLELPCEVKEGDPKKKTKLQNSEELDSRNTILGIQFSPCGKLLCAFSSAKQLILWETKNWTVISERHMPKTACSLAFSHLSPSIVIVDRSGDAFLFSTENVKSEGVMILGHLSMLLDVVVSPEDKFIVTSDRDEKIRVSHFPNAYNIAAYCLGHKEFVSSLCLLLHNLTILVSGSGDGTIRLWDYVKGLCLKSYDCSKEAGQELQLRAKHKDNDGDNSLTCPIKKVRCGFKDSRSSTLCVLFHGLSGCLVYCVDDVSIVFLQALSIDKDIIDVMFGNNGELWVYSYDKEVPVECFSFDDKSRAFSLSNFHGSAMTSMCQSLSNVTLPDTDKSCIVPQLFKRKFENVRDYYEQKKARIGE